MAALEGLSPSQLRLDCDASQLDVLADDQLDEDHLLLGHDRAVEALRYLTVASHNQHAFVMGPYDLAKRDAIEILLRRYSNPTCKLCDYIYLHNFYCEYEPIVLCMPPGQGQILKQDLAKFCISGHPDLELNDLLKKYADNPQLTDYLNALPTHKIIADLTVVRLIKVFHSQAHLQNAPIVYENDPTPLNLLGRVSDFKYFSEENKHVGHLRAGALHRANGGYLLLDTTEVSSEYHYWQALKQVLLTKKINIERHEGLDPQPVPLAATIILMGSRDEYYTLCEEDPEFRRLFPIAIDFSDYIDRTAENLNAYANWFKAHAIKRNLLPINDEGLAELINYAALSYEDQQRLPLDIYHFLPALFEADRYGRLNDAKAIDRELIQKAIIKQEYRERRSEDKLFATILRGEIAIETSGEAVGQINALSVLQVGMQSYGTPSRITASVGAGKGDVVDIEREVAMGGPLHSKGILILQGFLNSRFAQEKPLSMKASLVFEQNYGPVDGDSASAAELCALLSALANLPIKQSLSITGSVNQLGRMQAIGSVNEKIESFYKLCKARKLSGVQGVIIPKANCVHLQLMPELVEAVDEGRFHIYAVDHIDQALELLLDKSMDVIRTTALECLEVFSRHCLK